MPLFEVAILELPTKKEIEEGATEEKLVFGPECVIARDATLAGARAIMEHPESTANINRAKMLILVRPFA